MPVLGGGWAVPAAAAAQVCHWGGAPPTVGWLVAFGTDGIVAIIAGGVPDGIGMSQVFLPFVLPLSLPFDLPLPLPLPGAGAAGAGAVACAFAFARACALALASAMILPSCE